MSPAWISLLVANGERPRGFGALGVCGRRQYPPRKEAEHQKQDSRAAYICMEGFSHGVSFLGSNEFPYIIAQMGKFVKYRFRIPKSTETDLQPYSIHLKLIFLISKLIFLIYAIDKINFAWYNASNMNPQISTQEVYPCTVPPINAASAAKS
jgi:hypothetical protein